MECPACSSENRADRRFCASCGAALPSLCPTCGFANEASARFCGGCGEKLGQARNAGAPASAGGEGDLRPATILFADLVGSTALANRLEPEKMHALLGRFFESADSIIARFGGTVDKHIGDCVMAVFGAPIAHDNDPLRALSAAAELHGAVAGLDHPSAGLSLHIGLATGTVMASPTGSALHRRYTVTGPAVNLAARLCDRAAAGETLASQGLVAALGAAARAESLGREIIDGFDEPAEVFRILGLGGNDRLR